MSDLDAIAKDLFYAAGAGGARLSATVIAEGKAMAEVGAAIRKRGPGLTQLLRRRGTSATSTVYNSPLPTGQVTNYMVNRLVHDGLDLALGRKR